MRVAERLIITRYTDFPPERLIFTISLSLKVESNCYRKYCVSLTCVEASFTALVGLVVFVGTVRRLKKWIHII